MDFESVKWVGTLGVGGILAGGMFMFYRRDFMRERSETQQREDRLLSIIERSATAQERLTVAAGKVEHAANNLIDHLQWARRLQG